MASESIANNLWLSVTKSAFWTAVSPSNAHWQKNACQNCKVAVIACSSDAYRKALQELQKCGFCNVSHCQAVLGAELQRESIDSLLTVRALQNVQTRRRESFFDVHSVNALGCYLSHVYLWTKVANGDFGQRLFVCEEDVCAPQQNAMNLKKRVGFLVEEAGGVSNFDILWLSAQSTYHHGGKEQRVDFTEHLCRTKGPLQCTQAYVLTQRGARKLLQDCLPTDIVTDAYLWHMARKYDDFVLLVPKSGPLFEHSVFNFLHSSIGYSLFDTLSIIVPVQYRIYTFLMLTAFVLCCAPCLVV